MSPIQAVISRAICLMLVLVSATMQSIVYIVGAAKLHPFLEERAPLGGKWASICLGLSFLAIIHAYYVAIRYVLK